MDGEWSSSSLVVSYHNVDGMHQNVPLVCFEAQMTSEVQRMPKGNAIQNWWFEWSAEIQFSKAVDDTLLRVAEDKDTSSTNGAATMCAHALQHCMVPGTRDDFCSFHMVKTNETPKIHQIYFNSDMEYQYCLLGCIWDWKEGLGGRSENESESGRQGS
jgi:hypothetical protein